MGVSHSLCLFTELLLSDFFFFHVQQYLFLLCNVSPDKNVNVGPLCKTLYEKKFQPQSHVLTTRCSENMSAETFLLYTIHTICNVQLDFQNKACVINVSWFWVSFFVFPCPSVRLSYHVSSVHPCALGYLLFWTSPQSFLDCTNSPLWCLHWVFPPFLELPCLDNHDIITV